MTKNNINTNGAEIRDYCRKYLPHIENKRYQMITYRLYDSVPKDVIEQWRNIVAQGAVGTQTASLRNDRNLADCVPENNRNQADCVPHLPEEIRKVLILLDKYEDAGYGQCFMKNDDVAQIVYDNLMYHNHKKYELICWCIMPNHVHVLIELIDNISLSNILHSWRSYTSNEINKLLNRTGTVWMPEYFDRYIRDTQHFNKVVNYIHNNPVKAKLVDDPIQYKWSSYRWYTDGYAGC